MPVLIVSNNINLNPLYYWTYGRPLIVYSNPVFDRYLVGVNLVIYLFCNLSSLVMV